MVLLVRRDVTMFFKLQPTNLVPVWPTISNGIEIR